MLYYASDNDSIEIVIGEDIELLKVSASYPGGDNILEWAPEMKTTKNELVTASKTGEAGCLLFNMSDLTLNGGLKVEAGEPLDSLSAKIEVPNEYDENKCLYHSKQGTLLDNILFTAPAATEEDAWEAVVNIQMMIRQGTHARERLVVSGLLELV